MIKNKKENLFVSFLKSFIIGLGIIFPISASGLAVSMGMYERILNIINKPKKLFKKEWKFILIFIIGIALAAITSCLLINVTYNKYPVATLLLFEGLIIGGIPVIAKKAGKKWNFDNVFWSLIGLAAILVITFIGDSKDVTLSIKAYDLLKIFGAGALAAGTMIIPGVSGSAILIMIGFYKPMLAVISELVKFNSLGSNLLISVTFGVGMIIGILIVSRIMDYFLKKHERKTYFAIIGFIVGSIINIGLLIFTFNLDLLELGIGILLLVIGFIVSFKYLREE